MAAMLEVVEKLGVDAFVPGDSVSVPFCSHGPTLLFQRYIKGKSPRRYFACSASRDRKACQFFQWEDEKLTVGKEIMQREYLQKLKEEKDAVEGFTKLREETMKSKQKLTFCIQCSYLIFEHDRLHIDHEIRRISKDDLYEPSRLLLPAENKKTNAQYFFSESSTSLIVNLLKELGYESIICLGVPRIHEKLQKMNRSKSGKLESILLDLDKRYAQFLQPAEFFHYNMFNNFFYGGEEAEKRFKDFLAGAERDKIALVMDPPFGGLMSILAASIRKLLCVTDNDSPFDVKNIAIVMVFPYFLESHVSESFPSLKMMDYKVNYENHPHFKQRSSGRGSPIRIYTNIPGKDFVLPKNEGYRFCSICERYVSMENKHCQKCNLCSSKDGRTYIHCEKCGKCVKPDRIHCPTCKSCEQRDHDCEKKSRNLVTCHICGDFGHKRRDCQQKAVVKNFKRHHADSGETAVKKKVKTEERRKGRRKKTK